MRNDITRPRVSVVIPNYQHGQYLEERIQSVLSQSFQDFEIILLDDASTDGSKDQIESYIVHPKVSSVLLNEVNTGKPFLQWKRGMELARGSLVWIAESDDVAKHDFLATMVEAFDRYPGLVLATAMLEYIDAEGRSLGIVHEDLQGAYDGIDVFGKELGHRNCIRNASAVVFDKQVGLNYIDKVIGFRYSGDWKFWAMMAMHPKSRMYFSASPLCHYRLHETSVFGQTRGRRHPPLATERIRVLCDINLHPAAADTSAVNVRKFIALNGELWFWIYGLPSNTVIIAKLLFRHGHWHLPIILSMTLVLDFLRKLRNRVYRSLSRTENFSADPRNEISDIKR